MKRIKLLSTSKQLPLKCWYSLSDSKKLSTILDLKRQLVADLSLPCKPDEFMLEMDEYELLNDSKIDGVLRDNDTLSIHLVGKKRRASTVTEDKEAPLLKKKKTSYTEKTKDKPKKVVKKLKPMVTDKKETSKKNDKKALKKQEAELKKKKEKEEKKKIELKKKQKQKQKEQKKERELEERKKKMKKKEEEKEAKSKKKTVAKGKPVEVKILTKTQRRNLRRRILKQNIRESKMNSKAQEDEQQEEAMNDTVDFTMEEQQYEPIVEEQFNNNEMVDYNPYGRALVTSIECAPNFKSKKKKNNSRNFIPREYPVHKVPELFYAQQHVESYFVPPISDDLQLHAQDAHVQNGGSQQVEEKELNIQTMENEEEVEEEGKKEDENMEENDEESEESEESDSEEESDSDSEEEEEKDDGDGGDEQEDGEKDEKEKQATTKQVDIDYDTLAVLNFHDSPPHLNDRLAIKILELTSTYTPEISDWKHVLIKQIDPQAQAVVVEFEKGFSKASTKGGKFDIKKKKKRNNWYRGRRYNQDEQDDEEETDGQDKEEQDTTATILMTNIFEMRKLD